jgi:hypothetical protein
MAIRRCEAGEHTYDDTQHSSCPYCRKTRVTSIAGNDIPPAFVPPLMPERTMPASGLGGSSAPGPQGPQGPKTRVILRDAGGQSLDFDANTPVVGWLVVVKGQGLGRDLRLAPGMNSLGREKGDLLLSFGDQSISREKHAFIAYDSDANQFLLAHGEGRSLTKINGKTLMGSQELQAFDRIRLGETELLFVPLCGSQFSWGAEG